MNSCSVAGLPFDLLADNDMLNPSQTGASAA